MLQEDEKVNHKELECKLDELSIEPLNGCQIRNIVNTARQLARYRERNLSSDHVEQALEVVKEFEKYVTDMRGHTDEEHAKAQGHR